MIQNLSRPKKAVNMSNTKLKSRFPLAVLFIALALCLETRANDTIWTSNGPFGGKILALVIAPSNPQVSMPDQKLEECSSVATAQPTGR